MHRCFVDAQALLKLLHRHLHDQNAGEARNDVVEVGGIEQGFNLGQNLQNGAVNLGLHRHIAGGFQRADRFDQR